MRRVRTTIKAAASAAAFVLPAGCLPFSPERDEAGSGSSSPTSAGDDSGGDGDAPSGDETTTQAPGEPCPPLRACVPAAPEGWSGPVAYTSGPAQGGASACGDPFPDLVFAGISDLVWSPAQCTCECDASTLCGAVAVGWADSCVGASLVPAGAVELASEGDCAELFAGQPDWMAATMFEEDNGEPCPAITDATTEDPSAEQQAWICAGEFPGGGCPATQVCGPAGDPAFDSCVYRDGDHACPTAYPTPRSRIYDGFNDTRGCDCSCAPATGLECTATVEVSHGALCNAPYGTSVSNDADAAAACFAVETGPNFVQLTDVSVTSGGCTPSDSTSMGEVRGTGAVSVCCR